jgi:hypothetical protein
MFNTVQNKSIAVLGFAFKKDTGDVRESAAAGVCAALLDERAKLSVFDPKVKRAAMLEDIIAVEVSKDASLADIAAAGSKIAEIRIPATLPQTSANLGRFLRLNYTVAVSDFTAGNISAYIIGAHDNVPSYPAGVIVAN